MKSVSPRSEWLPRTATLQSYFTGIAQSHVHNAFKQGIQRGRLTLVDSCGSHVFGNESHMTESQLTAVLIIKDPKAYLRIWVSHDLGFSEAFMLGEVETPNLKDILDLWLDNRNTLNVLSTVFVKISNAISALYNRVFGQSLCNARLNAATNYDVSNELFQSFLSEEMQYSCAYWGPEEGGVRGDLEAPRIENPKALEGAQLRKVRHMLSKARLRPGDRLLEFGSGWGTMAIEAARLGCRVDTLTLSVEQKKLAEHRIRMAGFESLVTVHLIDYRQLPPEFEKAFDAFVSVEMIEAVGLRYLQQHYKILDWALKSDRATIVIASTTQPESRYSTYQATDFSRRYFWPTSFCPSPTYMAQVVQDATRGSFVLEGIEDTTAHYPRTLREWGRRLKTALANTEVVAALVRQYPEYSDNLQLDVFARMWHYMLVYSEVGYARMYTGMHIFTWLRPENISTICD